MVPHDIWQLNPVSKKAPSLSMLTQVLILTEVVAFVVILLVVYTKIPLPYSTFMSKNDSTVARLESSQLPTAILPQSSPSAILASPTSPIRTRTTEDLAHYAKVKESMQELRNAVEQYQTKFGQYPTSIEKLNSLFVQTVNTDKIFYRTNRTKDVAFIYTLTPAPTVNDAQRAFLGYLVTPYDTGEKYYTKTEIGTIEAGL